jgi:hypothetical protein
MPLHLTTALRAKHALTLSIAPFLVAWVVLRVLRGRFADAPELDRRRKEQELDQLRDFISDHTPHAIVVGAGPNEIDSRRFFEELTRAATTVEARKDLRHRIHVTYADSRIAKIYKNSSRSQKEFPDYAPLAREAVCLARFLQNPLIEYCGLTLDGAEEVLCLPFHPQQELVTPPTPTHRSHLLKEVYPSTQLNSTLSSSRSRRNCCTST